jgi:threonine dehydratase
MPQRHVTHPTSEDLARAREVVAAHLAPTPLIETTIDGHRLWLKLETLQPTGSFKVRGALAAMAGIPAGTRVLAASAGNHALGIAWAAAQTGTAATVIVAESASPAKLAKLATFPIEVVRHGASYDEAEAFAVEQAQSLPDGTVFISPYNDPQVIAGQSTMLDEIVGYLPMGTALTVVVPIGGGGLLAGICLRAEELRAQGHDIQLVGVEAAASPAISSAIAAGGTTPIDIGETIADGLAGNLEPGSSTVELIAGRVESIVQVDEEDMEGAIRALAWDAGVMAEGSGAASVAAILTNAVVPDEGRLMVAIVSGRNIQHATMLGILARG